MCDRQSTEEKIKKLYNKRYEVQRIVGEGGMGKVFLARDIKTGKKVAVKIVGNQKQWEREREILQKLNHVKGVPKLFFAGKEEEFFLVMEYIRGNSIKDYKNLCGKLSKKRMTLWMYKVCKILQKIHKEEIVHLDLKPENIIIHPSGKVYVIDFGVSLKIGESMTGYGTKIYASKKQKTDGEKATFFMDLYSLGKVMELNLKDQKMHQVKRIINKCLDEGGKYGYKTAKELKKDLGKLVYRERVKKLLIFLISIHAIHFWGVKEYKVGNKIKTENQKNDQDQLKKGMVYFYGNDQIEKDFNLAKKFFQKEKEYEKKAEAYLTLLDELLGKSVSKDDLKEALRICQEDVHDFWSAYFFEHSYCVWNEKLKEDSINQAQIMLNEMKRFSTDSKKQKILEIEKINLYEIMAQQGNTKYFFEETDRIFKEHFKDEKAWELYERKLLYLGEKNADLEKEYEQFIKSYPKVGDAYIAYGIYLCQKGKIEKARDIYRQGKSNAKMNEVRAQGLRRKLGL